jgi:phage repressor protein C with HTH and peptisase S24 domain
MSENINESGFFDEQPRASFATRVEQAIKPDSIRTFASKIDVSEGTLRRILKGEDPKLSIVERIAQVSNTDFLWLVKGDGDPSMDSLASPLLSQRVVNVDEFQEKFVLVPGYHISVSTGYGAFNDGALVERHLAFRKKWIDYKNLDKSQLAVVFAKGDSMEPTIHNNNTILVDLSDKKLSEGLIYVVRLGEELYAKRLQQYIDGSVRLISDNKEYVEQHVQAHELEQLEIIGKVVWIGKDLA